MSLILKQEPANTIATPPAGKSTLFVNDNSVMSVKGPDGNVTQFPTVAGSNTQVFFNDDGAIAGDSGLVYNKTSDTMTVVNLSVTGNLNAGDIGVSSIANGTSNVDIIGVSGNVTTSVNGTSNVLVVTATGANVTGTFSSTGNLAAGNISTGGLLSVIGNANVGNLGTATLVATTGNIDTLNTSLMQNGDSNVQIYPNAAIAISVDGNANVVFVSPTGIEVTGSTTTTTLSATGNANVGNLGTTGVFATTLSASGNANTGNLGTTGVFATTLSASGNANVGNIGTGGLITATGNLNAGNIITAGIVSATGNITGQFFIGNGSQLTGIDATSIQNGNSNVKVYANSAVTTSVAGTANVLLVSATGLEITGLTSSTGNATAGNLITGGLVTATGNVTGANLITAGTVFAPSIVQNAGAYQTKLTLDSANGIIGANTNGNLTQYLPSGAIRLALSGTKQLLGGSSDGSQIALANSALTVSQLEGGNVLVHTGTSGSITSTWNFDPNGNLSAPGAVSAAGNITGGNLTTGGTLTVTGNATVGNLTAGSGSGGSISGANSVTANYFTGTLTTAAQPNITSTGTLATLSVSGNANIGNVGTAAVVATTVSATGNANVGNIGTGGLVTATGNVTGGNLVTGGLVSAVGNIVSGANVVTDLIVGKTTGISITAAGTNQNINLVPTGTGTVNVGNFIISNVATPLAATDAATKQYVDDVAQGLHTHDSCNAATQTTLATISGGTVTYNNGTSGVGATLTTTGSYTTIDGVTLSNGMRILVKNEANAAHNGIYDRTSSTVLTRSTDFDTPTEMAGGDFTFVTAGTLYDNTGWVMTDPVTTVGTTSVVWTQFSGAGTYTAGTGLTLSGSQFSITDTTVSAGSYGNGDYNATFTVNGQGQLTAAANVALTPNAANLSGTTLKSTVVSSSLTSVGTLTSLSISGNANIGNIGTSGIITATGNANVGNIGAAAGVFTTVAGSLTTAAQPNVTSLGTLSSLGVNGTVTAVALTANTGVITGNANGISSVQAANIVGTTLSSTVVSSSLTAVGTLASLSVSGNITGANITGTHYGAATGLTSIPGGNVTGTVPSATTAGTVTTAAQPNITSVGTLSSLSVSGNANIGNVGAATGVYTTLQATTLTTGANTTAGTVTGNFTLSTGSRFAATYS